jgi:hypothetical protein
MKLTVLAYSLLMFVAGLVYGGNAKSLVVEENSAVVDQAAAPALIAPSNSEEDEALPAPAKPNNPTTKVEEASPSAKKPFMRPAAPRRVPAMTALSVKEENIPAPAPESIVEGPAIEVRQAPPIKYDTDRRARRMYRESGEMNVVMIARNPADGCYYEIPMCIPACCVGEPKVEGGRGILGRGVAKFCWECGFTAEVKFRHVLGDVKVDYEGD